MPHPARARPKGFRTVTPSSARPAVRLAGRAAAAAAVACIRAYQALVSPFLGNCCRYTPTCSRYAVQALRVHGFLRGMLLAAWRVLRCHPWARGGDDPVPPRRAAARKNA